ncbi:MAG: hypothetical protein Q9210_004725 [Variospora velana]
MPVSYPNHIENGREYHGYRRGMYMYPCDEVCIFTLSDNGGTLKAECHMQPEANRMDMLEKMFREARDDKIHEHPLLSHGEPPRVLDLGCGTGLWCMEMAEYELPLQIGFLMRADIPRYEEHTHTQNHLKPWTGRFEQVELDIEPRCDDGTLPETASIRQWYKSLSQATEIFNRPIAYNHATRQMLAAQGFVDIEERIIRIPMSTWSRDRIEKKLANWLQLVLVGEDGLEAYSLGPLTRSPVSWPADQVTRLCKEVGAEIVNRGFHMYNNMHIITARRP